MIIQPSRLIITFILLSFSHLIRLTQSLRRPHDKSTLSWTNTIVVDEDAEQQQSQHPPTTLRQQQQQQQLDQRHDDERFTHRRLLQSFSSNNPPPPLPNPDDHLVTSLPLLNNADFPSKHYAGHIPTTSSQRQIFYWLFEPPFVEKNKNAPLLIWLNGGPGCSSMDGLFLENGPFRLIRSPQKSSEEWTIQIAPYSWHNAPAWVVYVDQPVGTGLSFTRDGHYCRNDDEVNDDFYAFLVNFLKVHGRVFLDGTMTNREVFFAGESHAGHYIPSMMDYIARRNNDEESLELKISLGGAAIGNGWFDPYHQYSVGTAAYGAGLIDRAQWTALKRKEDDCHRQMNAGRYDASICFRLLDDVIDDSNGHTGYKVSGYDNRVWEKWGSPRSFPRGHKDVEAYLGNVKGVHNPIDPPLPRGLSEMVIDAIHATGATEAGQYYQECTDPPFHALANQDGKGVVPEIVRLLEGGVPLLFFNGIHDLMCNHVGNEVALDHLPWKDAREWSLAKRFVWSGSDKHGTPAGYVKTFENLSLLKVLEAGHMVPMDQPALSLEMMKVFLSGGTFEDLPQNDLKRDTPVDMMGDADCEVDCPECPSVPQLSRTSSGTTTAVGTGGAVDATIPQLWDKQEEHEMPNEDPARRFVIGGAWMGALLASVALAVNRMMTRSSGRRMVMTTSQDQIELRRTGYRN